MGDMTGPAVLGVARRLADEILFPAAMNVDAADRVPAAQFDALAEAGLYGLAGPADCGGLTADAATLCDVTEIMAGGCLATTFVWTQHHSAVRALAGSANSGLRARWLPALCRGERRAGIALAGVRPGPPLLRARPVPGGYLLDGTAPWVTGWDMIDLLHTVARDDAGNLIACLLPAETGSALTARRLELIAVNASRTVELTFAGYFVPAELVTGVMPQADWQTADAAGLRRNGSLALGVAGRCIAMIADLAGSAGSAGSAGLAGSLAAELDRVRSALDLADPAAMPAARAAASGLAFQAAGALVVAAGSQSILVGEHPQRLAREALFLLVFGSRPAIKESLAELLTGVGQNRIRAGTA
jgi:alkylation response protein AidB-like acyl-CoA dehydrogenase